MRTVEFRTVIQPNTFQPVEQLFVGDKQIRVAFTPELLQDLKVTHFGISVADEVRNIIKYEMETDLVDLELNLTQQELDKIWELVEEKLK